MAIEVKVLKMISGEEVIARTKSENTLVILDKPLLLTQMPDPSQPGRMAFGLVPWIISAAEEDTVVSVDHIIAQLPAKPEIEKMYLSQTSGLSLV
tara:strand:+ start:890 stop:1174 length:285 start_codon:yes stop_codon:yes gene_type:complete